MSTQDERKNAPEKQGAEIEIVAEEVDALTPTDDQETEVE